MKKAKAMPGRVEPVVKWVFPISDPHFRRAVAAKKDMCPECGGDLDTGWECGKCGYDAMAEAQAVTNFDIFQMMCFEDDSPPAIDKRGTGCC